VSTVATDLPQLETAQSATSGAPDPVTVSGTRLVELRLEEVEVHHVDLNLGYDFADTSADLMDQLIRNFADRRAAQGVPLNLGLDQALVIACGVQGATTVTGRGADALAWLAGRAGGNLAADTASGTPLDLAPLA
jgi:maleylpyruvate isomerase